MAKMIHLPNSTDIAEIRRVFELVQREQPKEATTTTTTTPKKQAGVTATQSSTSSSGGSSVGIPGPQGPAGADGTSASSNLMVGAMLVPEILLDANGDVLTDPSGYALIGVKVESVVLTGIGDTIQAMGV
jgi:hypothetical protein